MNKQRSDCLLRTAIAALVGLLVVAHSGYAAGQHFVNPSPAELSRQDDSIFAARFPSAGDPAVSLDALLPGFAADNLDVPSAAARLCGEHHILCGIEVLPWPTPIDDAPMMPIHPPLAGVSLSLGATTARGLLDAIVAADPLFAWSEDNGVANLYFRAAENFPDYPLTVAISSFQVADVPAGIALAGRLPDWDGPSPDPDGLFVLPEIRDVLPILWLGSFPMRGGPRITTSAIDSSAREILNEISRQTGLSWLLYDRRPWGSLSVRFEMGDDLYPIIEGLQSTMTTITIGEAAARGPTGSTSGQAAGVASAASSPGEFRTGLERLWDAPHRDVLGPDALIEQFQAVDQDVPTIVARLANEHAVLCGIAVVPHPSPVGEASPRPSFKCLNFEVSQVKVRDILDHLVAADPSFAWREVSGVITVGLRSVFENPQHPLNTVIPEFAAPDTPYLVALYGGPRSLGLFRMDWAKDVPFLLVGSGPAPSDYPPVTVLAQNQTPVQILNDMARQLKLSWWMFDGRLVGYPRVWFHMGLDLPGTPAPPSFRFIPASGAAGSSGQQSPAIASPASLAGGFLGRREATVVQGPPPGLVGLRSELSEHGFQFSWNPQLRQAAAVAPGVRLVVRANDPVARLNNRIRVVEDAPQLLNGRMLIPESLAALAMEALLHARAGR